MAGGTGTASLSPVNFNLLSIQFNGNASLNPGRLMVYLNPFTNTIQVESSMAIASDLLLYSAEGRLIATLQMMGTEKEIILGDLARGNYFLHFTVDGKTQVVKLIKQ